MTRAGEAAGFTLLELLVVLAVLGIAAAIAAPSIRPGSGPTVRLRAAMADVIDQLTTAREDAILHRRVHCIALTDAASRRGCAMLRLPEGVRADAGVTAAIRFHGDGSSNGARLALTSGPVTQSLTVIGATGQIMLR